MKMNQLSKTLFFRSQAFASKRWMNLKPHPIPKLEIMDQMVARTKEHKLPSLSNIAFIGAQHKLETTATLFKAMIELGAKPENMFFTGKCYSTCPEVEVAIKELGVKVFDDPKPSYPGGYSDACSKVMRNMWDEFNEHLEQNPDIEKIVILDDGGRVTEELKFVTTVSYPLVAIEQTRGGLYSKGLTEHGMFPIISVAQSAAKKIIEAPLIATAIFTRLQKIINDLQIQQEICGIIGNGATGKMVSNYLAKHGYKVLVYDQMPTLKNHKNISIAKNIKEMFQTCSFIFGCTGRDITEKLDLQNIITKDQIWISGSSEDREFKNFLLTNKENIKVIGDDAICTLSSGSKIIIKQQGFPFNFDRQPWNVLATDIEMTQCCLLGAVLQASLIGSYNPTKFRATQNAEMLNPYLQSFIVGFWGDREIIGKNRFDKDLLDMFKIPHWIEKESYPGKCFDYKILKTAFEFEFDLNAMPLEKVPNMLKFMR